MKTDKELKQDVREELRWEPGVHAGHINVSVKDGVVRLEGEVESYGEKWAAEKAAIRVPDVKTVATRIEVVLSHDDSHADPGQSK